MRRLIRLAVLIWLAAGCAAPAPEQADPTAELAELMAGSYQTSDVESGYFRDTRVRLPALGAGEWLYTQLNTGADQKLYRQRVLNLSPLNDGTGDVQQVAYSFRVPADFSEFLNEPKRWRQLRLEDLHLSFAAGCAMRWREPADASRWRWLGEVSPETCRVYSQRRKSEIAIGAEAQLGVDALWQTERGFALTGEQLFGSGPDEYTRAYRLPLGSN